MTIKHWTPGTEEFLGNENRFAMQFNFYSEHTWFHYVSYDPTDPVYDTDGAFCVAVFKLKKK